MNADGLAFHSTIISGRGQYVLPQARAHKNGLQYRSSFQSYNLIGLTVTRSQTSLGVKARWRTNLDQSDYSFDISCGIHHNGRMARDP